MARSASAARRARGFAVVRPVITARPAITGTPTVGQVLTGTTGTWTNTPTSYARQWTRDGVAIAGATAATYTLVSADSGRAIRVQVIATNANGPSIVVSSPHVTIA